MPVREMQAMTPAHVGSEILLSPTADNEYRCDGARRETRTRLLLTELSRAHSEDRERATKTTLAGDPAHLLVVVLATSPGATATATAAASPAAASSFCVAGFLRKNRARTIASRTAYGRTTEEALLHPRAATRPTRDECCRHVALTTADRFGSESDTHARTHAHTHEMYPAYWRACRPTERTKSTTFVNTSFCLSFLLLLSLSTYRRSNIAATCYRQCSLIRPLACDAPRERR